MIRKYFCICYGFPNHPEQLIFFYLDRLSIFLVMTSKWYDPFLIGFLNRPDRPERSGGFGIYLYRRFISLSSHDTRVKWWFRNLFSKPARPAWAVRWVRYLFIWKGYSSFRSWHQSIFVFFIGFPNHPAQLIFFLPRWVIGFAGHDTKVIWCFLNWISKPARLARAVRWVPVLFICKVCWSCRSWH